MEALSLQVKDLDYERELVTVRAGTGGRERDGVALGLSRRPRV